MSAGIILRLPDTLAQSKAESMSLRVAISDDWELPFDRNLFVAPRVPIPFGLLKVGFGLLARWDVAVPVGDYGILAAGLGTAEERERTQAIVGDLRILTYNTGLLFVRKSGDGEKFVETWRRECLGGGNDMLAFIRAMHIVKPMLCALPQMWIGNLQPVRQPAQRRTGRKLVKVEISSGFFVWVYEGDEAEMIERLRRQRGIK